MPGNQTDLEDRGNRDRHPRTRFSARLANALPFLTIIISLGVWSAGFYILQGSDSRAITEGLRCITFFGGLAAAALLGSLIGVFLKRLARRAFSNLSSGEERDLS